MSLKVEDLLLIVSILLFISLVVSKTGNRFGIPGLLLFIGVGMLAGSEGLGGIYFDDPRLTEFIGVIALNFILFSGGLETKWESVKPVVWRAMSLSTFGVLITAGAVGFFVHWLTDFSLIEGFLLGAIVSSTDAAAVFSILRSKHIGLKRNLRPTLELESGSNDPMAYFLTVSLTALAANPDLPATSMIWEFFVEMIGGAVVGVGMGFLSVRLLNRMKLEAEGLYPVLVLALMFFAFSFSHLIHGNGFLAVYISAIIMGNKPFAHKKSLIRFYDGQAWLMQIILFLTLGLLVFPSHILPLIGPGLLISVFLILFARPVGVFLSLMFFNMKIREKLFISWVGLRGAVPIVFATYPLIAGIEKSGVIFNLVFFIATTSVLLQGSSLHLVAKWLNLVVPEKTKRKFAIDLELSDSARNALQEFSIDPNSPALGKRIMDLQLPKDALIVLISRNESYFTPHGSSIIEPGDKLIITADNDQALERAMNIFQG